MTADVPQKSEKATQGSHDDSVRRPRSGAEGTHATAKPGKHLTFILGGEGYGIEILKVREIIGLMPITPVPRRPGYFKGVINLRGKIIPVIDLRLKFGMPETITNETCVIVVETMNMLVGLVVDTVSEVQMITEEEIEPPPAFSQDIEAEFICGMGKTRGKVKILLDIDRVLSGVEFDEMEKSKSPGAEIPGLKAEALGSAAQADTLPK